LGPQKGAQTQNRENNPMQSRNRTRNARRRDPT
jgi:hypothetical protein